MENLKDEKERFDIKRKINNNQVKIEKLAESSDLLRRLRNDAEQVQLNNITTNSDKVNEQQHKIDLIEEIDNTIREKIDNLTRINNTLTTRYIMLGGTDLDSAEPTK
jgi:hypothetical protein